MSHELFPAGGEQPPRAEEAGGGADAARGEEHQQDERPERLVPRQYYSIGEVCDLVDLRPHVLRYWETQFPPLSPPKNRGGKRVYQRKQIKLILLIRRLLYDEKYTIDGAKRKLEQLRRGGELQAATARGLEDGMIALLRRELRHVLEALALDEPS